VPPNCMVYEGLFNFLYF